MSEPPKDKDQEKGDEILRRLLKTAPDPKAKPLIKKRRAEARRPPVSEEDRENGGEAK
jgi:hypothetical protein